MLADNRKVVGADSRQLSYVPMGRGGASTGTPPMLTPEMVAPTVNATDGDPRPARGERPTGREEVSR